MNNSSPPDLDILMERIRAELKKAKSEGIPSAGPVPSIVAEPQIASSGRRQYRFGQFKSLDSENFVRNAYLATLGREPDEAGRMTLLHRLESGQTGRASVLLELMNSDEGRQQQVDISGLGIHPILDRFRYNRFTRMVPVATRLMRNSPRIAAYIRQLAAQAASAERLALRAVASAEAAQRLAKAGTLNRPADALPAIEIRLQEQRAWLERQLDAVRRDLSSHLEHTSTKDDVDRLMVALEARIEDVMSGDRLMSVLNARLGTTAPLEAVERLSTDLGRMHSDVQRKLSEHWRSLVDQKLRLDVLLKEARRRMPEPFNPHQVAAIADEEQHILDAFYVSFEDRYRGTRADIKDRQKIYIPDIKRAAAETGGAPIVDLGCGRGEWLELLKESGFTGQGYDLNRIMVQESRDRGLDVTLSDALEAMAALPNDSVAAVTGFHIIEHLPFATLVRLFDEALRVLRPGGLVIFETPNPGNLLVASEQFYMDPTHRNPLPAELIAFVTEARGFTAVESRFLHPPAERRTERLNDPTLDLLRERIYAPQDYAVIGWKA